MEKEYNSEENSERKYTPKKPSRLRNAVISTAAGLALLVGGAYVLYFKVFPATVYYMLDNMGIRFAHKSKETKIVSTKPKNELDKYGPSDLIYDLIFPPDRGILSSGLGPNFFSNYGEDLGERIMQNPGIRDALLGPGVRVLEKPSEEKEFSKYVVDRVIIPGNLAYDIDSKKFSGKTESISSWTKSWTEFYRGGGDIKSSVFVFGTKEGDADVKWQHIDNTKRRLVPINKAKLTRLGRVNLENVFGRIDFENISLEDLTTRYYSKQPIIGDDDNNQMTPGTVIGIRTNKGEYAKMLIEGYVPLGKGQGDKNIKNYHLRCTITYKPK